MILPEVDTAITLSGTLGTLLPRAACSRLGASGRRAV
jgi:hypothetical protein